VKRVPPSYIKKKLEDLGKIPPIDVKGELNSGIEKAINSGGRVLEDYGVADRGGKVHKDA